MSIESAKAFLDKLDTDHDLRRELFAGNEHAERVAVSAERLAELATRYAFSATADEIRRAGTEQGRLPTGELGDGELEAVAGGSGGKVSMQDFHFVINYSKVSPTLLSG